MLICYSSYRKPRTPQSQPKPGLLVILPGGPNCLRVRDTNLIFRSDFLELCSLTLRGDISFSLRMRKTLSLTTKAMFPQGNYSTTSSYLSTISVLGSLEVGWRCGVGFVRVSDAIDALLPFCPRFLPTPFANSSAKGKSHSTF